MDFLQMSAEDRRTSIANMFLAAPDLDAFAKEVSGPQNREKLINALCNTAGAKLSFDVTTDQGFSNAIRIIGLKIGGAGDHEERLEAAVDLVEATLMNGAAPSLSAPNGLQAQTPNSAPMVKQTLFSKRSAPGHTGKLAGLLLPSPPMNADMAAVSAWVSGQPWANDTVGVCFDTKDPTALAELADLEGMMMSAPGSASAAGCLFPQTKQQGDPALTGMWLNAVGRDLGLYTISCQKAATAWRFCIEAAIDAFRPELAGKMVAAEAQLVFGEDVPGYLADALDIEACFLAETTPAEEAQRPAQDFRGDLSAHAGFTRGVVLKKAAHSYLAGVPLTMALQDAVISLRLAQVHRLTGTDQAASLTAAFDDVFFNDCSAPLDAYVETRRPAASFQPSMEVV